MSEKAGITIIISILIFATITLTASMYFGSKKYDYNLNASPAGYELYSNGEKIGFIPAGNSKLDSLIINHNQ